MKKIVFGIVGCISLTVGILTTITPFPTIPFLLAATFCFANSSEKLSNWFCNTKIYQKRLQSILEKTIGKYSEKGR